MHSFQPPEKYITTSVAGFHVINKAFKWGLGKGRLVSKCLFDVFKFFKKTNESKSTRGIIVVKSNFLVRFFGYQKVLLKLTEL